MSAQLWASQTWQVSSCPGITRVCLASLFYNQLPTSMIWIQCIWWAKVKFSGELSTFLRLRRLRCDGTPSLNTAVQGLLNDGKYWHSFVRNTALLSEKYPYVHTNDCQTWVSSYCGSCTAFSVFLVGRLMELRNWKFSHSSLVILIFTVYSLNHSVLTRYLIRPEITLLKSTPLPLEEMNMDHVRGL